jgi:TRAP-type C4-dicarboxylate transport system permease small subunit
MLVFNQQHLQVLVLVQLLPLQRRQLQSMIMDQAVDVVVVKKL